MAKKLILEPPPQSDDIFVLKRWLYQVYDRLGEGPLLVKGYTVATMPDADKWYSGTENYSAMIFVSDESGGAVMAFTDGTNWRRVTDRAIVS